MARTRATLSGLRDTRDTSPASRRSRPSHPLLLRPGGCRNDGFRLSGSTPANQGLISESRSVSARFTRCSLRRKRDEHAERAVQRTRSG